VLNIGLDLGVISPTLFTMMVLTALVTTLMTTPLLDVLYSPRHHLRELLAQPRPVGEVVPRPDCAPFAIVACVADARSGVGLLALARALSGTRLHALHLLGSSAKAGPERASGPGMSPAPGSNLPGLDLELGPGVKAMSFVSGDPAHDICSFARVQAADLVLLGRRSDEPREGLGTTTTRVLAQADCDVAVLMNPGLREASRVVVSLAASRDGRAAWRLAQRLLDGGAEITAVESRGSSARTVAQQVGHPASPRVHICDLDDLTRSRSDHDLLILGADERHELPDWLSRLERPGGVQRGISVLLVRGRAAPPPRSPGSLPTREEAAR